MDIFFEITFIFPAPERTVSNFGLYIYIYCMYIYYIMYLKIEYNSCALFHPSRRNRHTAQ